MYPEAVSPVPTETVYNEHSLERASSIGEITYDTHDANGFVGNGYGGTNMNGESVAASPTPYSTSEYNGNGYTGYDENGSVISANGNGSIMSGFNGNDSTVCGYNGNENGSAQFVRRRLLPSIPKGEKHMYIFFLVFSSPAPLHMCLKCAELHYFSN